MRPRISFALKDKPFMTDIDFHHHHLVASISVIGGGGNGADYLFVPPYVLELNQFVSHAMSFGHKGMRLERGRLGVIIEVRSHDLSLYALPVPSLFERIFALMGFNAKPSGSGLITRQLIARMGGVDGTRAFKISGVRKLLKTYGPNTSFSRRAALQLIGSADSQTGPKFSDYRRLFIEARL
ncbi:hypothetical protein LP421_25075 [Rhizobium sp. RCAM05350]|nr:hypothetical protein LP421_25075 [Rhizobium sp. RCAM05350]